MYKLLIADDEYEIRNGISNYFPWHEIGFEVVGQAENGLDALQFISEHNVDVLLCDVRMPVMTGIDLAHELYLQKSNVTILFISGYKDFEYVQKALVYGVKNYILKPTKYSELVHAFTLIREDLDRKRHTALPYLGPESNELGKDETSAFSDKIIQIIIDYVEKHYKQASLETVSKVVRMNRDYVSKYFKQKTGENFSDFVIRIKMKKAAELFKDHRYKTYEVSELVGYRNAKNFTRTFRKHFGKSPREFRNSN